MAKTKRLALLWPVWAAAGYVFSGLIYRSPSDFPGLWIWLFHAGWSLLFLLSLFLMLRYKPTRVGFLFLAWSVLKIIAAGAFALWASYHGIEHPVRFATGFMLLYVWFTLYEWMLNVQAIGD